MSKRKAKRFPKESFLSAPVNRVFTVCVDGVGEFRAASPQLALRAARASLGRDLHPGEFSEGFRDA